MWNPALERVARGIDAHEAVDDSQPSPQDEQLPAPQAKHLQNLYRKLAKRYHPDKTIDAKEQHRREQLMPLINRAYQEQDIQDVGAAKPWGNGSSRFRKNGC